ncbi:DUF192 domain-containing protein [Balneola sp. MJW-20]|uniref:DUF192 domain-containing protein n=1 Tax=Gracilimonas aurantiaca TaxID=3234185 RepID=UPI0034670220
MKLHSQLIKSLLLLIISAGIIACSSEQESTNKPPASDDSRVLEYSRELTFLDTEGNAVSTIDVAIADDDSERAQGLMDVKKMPTESGMLFIFPDEQARSFWMANTPLPLDILYVAADSTIVRIYTQTRPYSQESLPSGSAAKFVVEVNGGYTINRDIREGYRIRF